MEEKEKKYNKEHHEYEHHNKEHKHHEHCNCHEEKSEKCECHESEYDIDDHELLSFMQSIEDEVTIENLLSNITHHEEHKHDEKIKELEKEIKELQDKALRDKAETINYRKRKEEEIARMLKFCNEDMIVEMLPIIDNFESAIKMDDDNLEDEVSKFLAGFKMIYSNLVTILNRFDVKAIDGNNKPFDPAYHQAVLTEKRDDLEPGTVIEVLRKGYLLKDKVIRPAMVKVSE